MAEPGASLDVGAFPNLYHDYASDDQARIEERKLTGALEGDALYVDASFPATGSSLYYNEFQPPKYAIPPAMVEWNRIGSGEVEGCHTPIFTSDAAGGGGIVQGALRDRWFLSALGLAQSKPEMLGQILVSSAMWKKGIYTVKFFKAGKWRYVHVDDRIPCDRSGRPHFARSPDPCETWVMVVEKAFAKLHSCYEAIIEGGLEEGLKDATGCPTSLFRFAAPDVAPKIADASLWTEMLDLLARGSLVGVCDNRPRRQPLDPISAENAPSGLLKSHVYVVEKLLSCEADATAEYDALETKMIKLKNPWQLGSWNGNWSATSALWTQYPPIAAACGTAKMDEFAAKEPSSFWMEWADFVTQFDTLVLTQEYAKDGARMTYRGAWLPGDERSGHGGPPTEAATWKTNPQYVFDVTEVTRFCASVTQVDPRWQPSDVNLADATPCVGFSIQHVPGGRRAGKFKAASHSGGTPAMSPQRTVCAPCLLHPGSYALVPSTSAPGAVKASFVVEMHADALINFQNGDDEMPDLDIEEDDPDNVVAADADAAAKLAEVVPPAARLPEPEGRELESLWSQAAFLSTFLKDLAAQNKGLETSIKALENPDH